MELFYQWISSFNDLFDYAICDHEYSNLLTFLFLRTTVEQILATAIGDI